MRTRRRAETRRAFSFGSPFPPLELTAGDEARLEDMAYFLVQSTIAEYQSHLSRGDGAVDRDQWKFVKRKQKVRVYVERREKDVARRRKRSVRQYERMRADVVAGMSASSTSDVGSFCCFDSTWSSAADTNAASATGSGAGTWRIRGGGRGAAQRARSSLGLPAFLVAGSVEGSLDDAMFGAVSATVDAMRVKAAYVGDGLVDAAVLATLVSPTADDPFRSLSVKWVEREAPVPRLLTTLVKNHDAVVLESTGVARLASGERVGYVLLHSVQFPEAQPLASAARMGVSMCTLFRETSSASLDLFTIGNVDPVSGVMRSLAVKSTVDSLVSVRRLVECARMKKLAWALNQQYACSIGDISEPGESGEPEAELDGRPSRDRGEDSGASALPSCTHCKREAPPTSRRHLLAGISKKLRRTKTTRAICVLCCEYVCPSCTVMQTLSYVDTAESRSTSAAAAHRTARSESAPPPRPVSATRRQHQHEHEQRQPAHRQPHQQRPRHSMYSHPEPPLSPSPSPPQLREREITFCALCILVAAKRTSTLAVAAESAAATARNSDGHKSLITAWLRGTLDMPPPCRYSQC